VPVAGEEGSGCGARESKAWALAFSSHPLAPGYVAPSAAIEADRSNPLVVGVLESLVHQAGWRALIEPRPGCHGPRSLAGVGHHESIHPSITVRPRHRPSLAPLARSAGNDNCLRTRPRHALRRCSIASPPADPSDATQLLHASRAGDRESFDVLFALAYDELRRAAHFRLGRRRTGETLSTTVLVHEAYVRLVDQTRAQFVDRAHFLAIASRAMRFVLIDHLRAGAAEKRGGGAERIPLDAVQLATGEPEPDLMALHEALEQLSEFSPRLARLVEYRFFGGLTYDEIAEVTGLSVPTVKRDWTRARAWLFRAMNSATYLSSGSEIDDS
jgi:RNA polymerase sigma factor (TIGR02999 family)